MDLDLLLTRAVQSGATDLHLKFGRPPNIRQDGQVIPLEGFNARTYGPPGLEEDIAFCARENVLDVVPRLTGMVGPAAEITA